MRIPRVTTNWTPFSSQINIDNYDSILTIGDSDEFEDVFCYLEQPNYIKLLCELIPNYNLPNVSASFKFRNEIDDIKLITKSFNLYNNDNYVSNIDILLKDSISNIVNLPFGSKIFQKHFKFQTNNRNMKSFETKIGSLTKTTTAAFAYAGKFNPSMEIKDIQQCLFYIEKTQTPQLKIISTKEFLQQQEIKLSKEINISSLSSLEDDIVSGKVVIKLDSGIFYKSFSSKKTTLTNNLIFIYFKKADII